MIIHLKLNIRKKLNIKLLYLIITGELIFALPFHVNRFFRPALLEEYGYSNTMMGMAFTVYGISALVCYLPGGIIADKIDPRKLLAISLLLTSLGGMFLLTYPNFITLCIIYGYWGITSILFCWGALIKATRLEGGKRQGMSFGLLEAGRGLVASISATVASFIFANVILLRYLNDFLSTSFTSLSLVIIFYSFITMLASLLIWFCYKTGQEKKLNNKKYILKDVLPFNKSIIYQAFIVFSAYSAYKGVDYYAQYFYEVLKYTKEDTAFLMSNLSYLRPLCAVSAGIIADKITSSKSCIYLFIISSLSYLILSLTSQNIFFTLIFSNLVISMIAVFSIRGIYFSLIQEAKVPINITGIAVGIISLVGFFPDIYIGPLFGSFLDNYQITKAFQKCFIVLFCVSLLGAICSAFLRRR